jgi:hypothetical protein
MTFYIRARDAAGCITLRRDSQEAAVKKAEELRDTGYFDSRLPKKPMRKLPSLRRAKYLRFCLNLSITWASNE